jgi:hypothetical protein
MPSAALPPAISEEIDYDNDGVADFQINYDKVTNTATLVAHNPKVLTVEGSYILKERRTVRVNQRK